MPLGGISVVWDVTTPSGTSLAGTGQNDIRSLKTTLNQVLDSEHVFGATGGSNTGVHRKGSAVVFVGASSAISSTDTNGRLMLTSDTSRLHHVGSDNTIVLGGRFVPEMAVFNNNGSNVTSAVTQMWTIEAGQFQMPTASTGTVFTLKHTYLMGVAMVTPWISGGAPMGSVFPIGGVSSNQLTVYNWSSSFSMQSVSSATYLVNYVVFGIKAI